MIYIPLTLRAHIYECILPVTRVKCCLLIDLIQNNVQFDSSTLRLLRIIYKREQLRRRVRTHRHLERFNALITIYDILFRYGGIAFWTLFHLSTLTELEIPLVRRRLYAEHSPMMNRYLREMGF